MKLALLILSMLSFNAYANCPRGEYTQERSFKLYQEDTVKEIYRCKMISGKGLKDYDFCVAESTHEVLKKYSYLGIQGVEITGDEYYGDREFGAPSIWVIIGGDKEGIAWNNTQEMGFDWINNLDIMQDIKLRYTFRLNKKTNLGSWTKEEKKKLCPFCSWEKKVDLKHNAVLITINNKRAAHSKRPLLKLTLPELV